MSLLGRRVDVGLAKEASRLTAETTPVVWLPKVSFDLQRKNEYFEDTSSFGRVEELLNADIAQSWAEGSIEGMLDADTIGYPLFHTFGSVNSVTTSGATTHTFDIAQTETLPTATYFYELAQVGWLRSVGVAHKDLEISIETMGAGGKYKSSLVAIKEETVSTQTPSYTKPTRFFIGKHTTAKIAANTAGLSGASNVGIKKATIKVNRNSEVDFDLGSQTGVEVYSKQASCEVTLTATMKTTAFDTLFRNGTKNAIQINLENTNAADLGGSGLKPKLTITLAPSLFDITYSRGNNDITTFDATIKGEYSIADSYMIRAILINTISSY